MRSRTLAAIIKPVVEWVRGGRAGIVGGVGTVALCAISQHLREAQAAEEGDHFHLQHEKSYLCDCDTQVVCL